MHAIPTYKKSTDAQARHKSTFYRLDSTLLSTDIADLPSGPAVRSHRQSWPCLTRLDFSSTTHVQFSVLPILDRE